MGRYIDVLGSPNDTDYAVMAEKLDPNDSMYQWYKEDQDKFVASGDIDLECGSFSPALSYAVEQGWIPSGSYIVTVSW